MKLARKYKDSLGVKLAVFFTSLLLCLAALEGGLRLAGYAVTTSRQREFIPPVEAGGREIAADDIFERYRPGKRGARLVLTLGDSLTNNGNVKSRHSYPYFLYRDFQQAGKPVAVYNLGYCEDSTFGVALKLKNYLRSHPREESPDAVVILVGAADLFNIPLIREGTLKDDTFWRDVLPRGWVYSSRLYKVYRHIATNLALRSGLGVPSGGQASVEEKFSVLRSVYERHKNSRNGDFSLPLAPGLVGEIEAVFGKDYQQADLDFGEMRDFMELLTDYAARVYTTQHRYEEYFALMLDMALSFPQYFWNAYYNTANYSLIQSYQVQSKYTAEEVLAALKDSESEHPLLAKNDHFQHFRKILLDREEMNSFVDRKRAEAWEDIIRMSRERNFRVVLQNYPVEYKSANRMLRRTSEKYGLPLVDNRSHFAKLIEEGGREKYLEDDDHMTPSGYEEQARNVFKALADWVPAEK